MQREIRTLWWILQGLLMFLILAFSGFVMFGWILSLVHAAGAIYSQFIQAEAQ